MARIVVIADAPTDALGPMLYQERVCASLLQSAHASAQLLERLKWAVADAEEAELRPGHADARRPLR